MQSSNKDLANEKLKSDGSDIRVVRGVTNPAEVTSQVEIFSFDSSATKIWFEINATALEAEEYFVYYGNERAQAPNYESKITSVSGTTDFTEAVLQRL